LTAQRYWHPLKYTAKMREAFHAQNANNKAARSSLLLRVTSNSGHFGVGGRFGHLREIAFDYSFLYKALGLKYITS
jgi:protease II